MKNIYVIRKMSKGGLPYVMAYVDLGYKNLAISFDIAFIVELTGYSFEFVNTLELDKPLNIGTFNKVGK